MVYITENEIAEIQSLKAARNVCKKYNISTKGLSKLQDFQERLRLFLNDQTVWKYQHEFFAERIKQSVDKFKETRTTVGELSQRAKQSVFQDLESEIVEIVKAFDEGYLENMDKHSRYLLNYECPILVAGEISAGKSSLINLIVGFSALPVGHLHTTTCVCELRYSSQSSLKSFTWNTSDNKLEINQEIFIENTDDISNKIQDIMSVTSKNKKLVKSAIKNPSSAGLEASNVDSEEIEVTSLSISSEESCIDDDFVDLKLSSGKLEIYSNFEFLKDGIFLVDSPGIGETSLATEQVVNYLPNACSIIYVINAENAGGIQEDRLIRLLTEWKKIRNEKFKSFSPETAIFIVNKWDTIPITDRDTVEMSIKRKLKRVWPGFRDSQLILFSSIRAFNHFKAGFISNELKIFHGLIANLVEDSLKKNITDYCSWLHSLLGMVANRYRLLTNCSFLNDNIRGFYLNDIKNKINSATEIIEDQECHDNIEKIIDDGIKIISASLFQFLNSSKFKTCMNRWCLDDIPIREKVTDIKEIVGKLVEDRFIRLLTQWEEDDSLLRKFNNHIHKSLTSCYGEVLEIFDALENKLQIDVCNVDDLRDLRLALIPKENESWQNIYTGVGILTGTIGGGAAGVAIGLSVAEGAAAAVIGGVIGSVTGGIGIAISLIIIGIMAGYAYTANSVSRQRAKILSIIQTKVPDIISKLATEDGVKGIVTAYTDQIKTSIKSTREQIVKHLRANEALLDEASQKDYSKIRGAALDKINIINELRIEINNVLKLYDCGV